MLEKNKALLKAEIGRFLKKKRLLSKKSLTLFCYENSVPNSSLSYIERGMQDPSVTTLFRIVEAHGMKMSEFFKLIEKELPKNFSLIDLN